jgi:hypothetical protein
VSSIHAFCHFGTPLRDVFDLNYGTTLNRSANDFALIHHVAKRALNGTQGLWPSDPESRERLTLVAHSLFNTSPLPAGAVRTRSAS